MRTSHSHNIFFRGSLLLISISALYYFLIPRYTYFGEGWSIYPSGETLPEHLNGDYGVSNIYLLNRLTIYFIEYLVLFVALYLILAKFRGIEMSKKYVWWHLILVWLGSLLLLFVNPYIAVSENNSLDIADIFFMDELTEDQILHSNELMLWYSAIGIKTSIIGILLFMASVIVFLVGTFRAWNTGANTRYTQ
jgi:hypothetical protein